RDGLDRSLQEGRVGDPRPGLVLAGDREHLVGHVDAVRVTVGSDTAGGKEHVQPRATPQVKHVLAAFQVGKEGWIAAAKTRRRVGTNCGELLAGVAVAAS